MIDRQPIPAKSGVSRDERLARLALMRISEPGDEELGRQVAAQGAEAVLAAICHGELKSPRLAHYRTRITTISPDHDLAAAKQLDSRFICPGDSEWPTQLDDLGLKRPLGLWVRGESNLRHAVLRSVAVVGTRAATPYGNYVAGELSMGLAERGWTVVSGAAYGIDAAAHRGSLAGNGLTVAVLACALDLCYPRGHEALLHQIATAGLLVSEHPFGCPPARFRFLERNRVIAALTRGTVVVEAAYRSGALNTAKHADALRRHVMGVPGPVTSSTSAGVHTLLRDRGGVLVTDAADVIEQVGLIGDDLAPPRQGPASPRDDLDELASRVLEAMPARQSATIPGIAQQAGIAPDSVVSCLGALAVDGWVEHTEKGWRLAQSRPLRPARSAR